MSRTPSRWMSGRRRRTEGGGARRRHSAIGRAAEPLEPRTLLAASLVKDINAIDTFLSELTNVNGTLFFTSHDPSGGVNLEKTTASGAVLVRNFPTTATNGYDSAPSQLTAAGGKLFFTVDDGVHGDELWTSDGTAAGTTLVDDVVPGIGGSNPGNLTAVGSKLFFAAGPASARQVYVTDGTAAGTAAVTTFPDVSPNNSTPSDLTAVGGALFFKVTEVQPTTSPEFDELWKSDGTPAGTTLLKGFGTTGASDLTALNSSTLLFQAPDFQNSLSSPPALWRSDGTAAGTTVLMDIAPNPGGYSPFPVLGGMAFFSATTNAGTQVAPDYQLRLWRTDGTAAGTTPFATLQDFGATQGNASASSFIPAGGLLFFTTPGSQAGHLSLWRTDGTTAGTSLLADVNAPSLYGTATALDAAAVGGTLYFANNDPAHGYELWKSDGTSAGTALFEDLDPGPDGSFPKDLVNLNGTLFFSAHNIPGVNQLWKSDGTIAGTAVVQSFSPGATRSGVEPYYNAGALVSGGKLYFTADDGVHGREPWVSDGTAAGTMLLKDINPGTAGSDVNGFEAFGNKVVFAATDGPTNAAGLWVTDGTPGGTTKLIGGGSFVGDVTPFAGAAYFTIDQPGQGDTFANLYRTDGTVGGTTLVASFAQGSVGNGLTALGLTVFGGKLYFGADDQANGSTGDQGIQLWSSDGTAAGTTRVTDIAPNLGTTVLGLDPRDLTVFNGKLDFSGQDSHGQELWASDGTTAGTTLVDLVNPGANGSYPYDLTVAGGKLFFINGVSLYSTDGTSGGTTPLQTAAQTSGPFFRNLAAVNGQLVYTFDDGSHGKEPWISDGTVAGTRLLKDINHGLPSSQTFYQPEPKLLNGLLYFAADDGTHGTELWRTDGTTVGTVLVNDINPGPGASYPGVLGLLNGQLLVAADDGVHGSELMSLDPNSVVPSHQAPGDYYGTGSSQLGFLVPETSTLYVVPPAGSNLPPKVVPFANPGGTDVPVAVDVDGDGKTDLAVFNPTIGRYLIIPSDGGPNQFIPVANPAGDDIPVVGDYYGTGSSQLGFFVPETSTLYVVPPAGSNLPPKVVPFANPGGTDVPVAVDVDGDGKTDLAVFNPTLGRYLIIPSGGGPNRFIAVANPANDDLPVVGDFYGVGSDQLGFFVPETSTLYVVPPAGSNLPPKVVPFANPGGTDVPVAVDVDGDGKTDLAVFNPTLGRYLIIPSGGGPNQFIAVANPANDDLPVPGSPFRRGSFHVAEAVAPVVSPLEILAQVIPDTEDAAGQTVVPTPTASRPSNRKVDDTTLAAALDALAMR